MSAHPGVRAAMVQFGCLPLAFALAWLGARAGATPGPASLAVLQGVLATLLSWRWRLPPWWLPIQFAFAPLLLLALSARVPAGWWLGGFLLLLALFGATFRTRVPYFPSIRSLRAELETLLPAGGRAIDIGSGLGGLVLHLAARRPDARVEGIELAPLPWLASRLRAVGSRASLRLGDYRRLDLSAYDLVFAYLSPAAMPALWEKAIQEMRDGAVLASYEFAIPDVPPTRVVMPHGRDAPLYIWVVKR